MGARPVGTHLLPLALGVDIALQYRYSLEDCIDESGRWDSRRNHYEFATTRGWLGVAPGYTEGKGQAFSLQVRLAVFVLLAGGAILLFTFMLIQVIWKCFTMGCSALVPMRIRSFWSPVPMPVHVHIAFDSGILFLLIVLFWLGYNDLTEESLKRSCSVSALGRTWIVSWRTSRGEGDGSF